MRLAPLRKIEQAVKAADSGSIRERWRYGRMLLVDPDWTTAGGSLRDGRRAKLAAEGVSEREISYRLECAKTYPCESQIVHAGAEYKDWTALRNARFPEYPKAEGERPYDPRTTSDLKSDQDRPDILPHDFEQTELFAACKPEETLLEVERYVLGQIELAGRFSERTDLRLRTFNELVKAVGGDKTRTLAEALAALAALDEEAT